METKEEVITTYKYDGKTFSSKEQLENYKKLYISDENMIELYKLFHRIPEDVGDFETAKVPGDAEKYEILIQRFVDGTHQVHLRRQFKTIQYGRRGVAVSECLIENLVIEPNRDFKVGFESKRDSGGMFVFSSRVYCTTKIIDFFNLMKNLGIFIPDKS